MKKPPALPPERQKQEEPAAFAEALKNARHYELRAVWTYNGVKHVRIQDVRTGEYTTLVESELYRK